MSYWQKFVSDIAELAAYFAAATVWLRNHYTDIGCWPVHDGRCPVIEEMWTAPLAIYQFVLQINKTNCLLIKTVNKKKRKEKKRDKL